MTTIIGFGNSLRGEDGFGIDVISKLQEYKFENIKLISTFQLTPELCLQLQNSSKLFFVDAAYMLKCNYELICSLEKRNQNLISHHISIETILTILKNLYSCNPSYEIISMATNNFDYIENKSNYFNAIEKTVKYILKTIDYEDENLKL